MPKPDKSKQIDLYTSEALSRAVQYKKDVKSGKQVANKWIKLAVQRSDNDQKRKDIYFDKSAVLRVFKFFYFIRIKNGKRYTRFVLTPYQAWIIYEIFGYFYNDNIRRYRYATLYTARKSGKTVFSVAIELYMLMYDQEEDPEAYLCATTREQAGQALRYSKNIVKNSPSLKRRLKVQQFQIIYEKRSGLLKVLANKPESNDSLNPYVFIIDEMHAHPTIDFFNVMKSGIMSRENPLGIITSTAGFNRDYPFFKMIETAKKVLEGLIEDDITFYALYTLDDEDEVEDYDAWVKANPNVGQTIRIDALKKEYLKAKLMPTELVNFITKNLNRYMDPLDQWIPDDQYKKNQTTIQPPTDKRLPAFVGIDLSSVRDLASMVLSFTDPNTNKVVSIPEFYFPQNEIKRIRDSGIDMGDWIKKGWIIEHDSPTIDHEKIYERVQYWHTVFDIQLIFYDKWNSAFLIPKIEQNMFIDCRHFDQTTTWFNFPLKYIEKLFFGEELAMGENPVMRWMYHNIVLYFDGNMNIKIMKNKSADSVDGPVAHAMSIGAWLEYNGDTTAEFFKQLLSSQYKKEES